MLEHPEKKYEPKENSPEKGWADFIIRLRKEVIQGAEKVIKVKPEEEAIISAQVEIFDEALKEIKQTAPEARKQFIESCLQDGKIDQDVYEKLMRRIEIEAEMKKIETETGLGQDTAKEKITGPEAAQEVADTIQEVIQKNPFWVKFRERISGAGIKSKEIYQAVSKTLQEKKVLGISLRDHLVNMGTGAAVRTTTRWGLGFLTGGAGYFLTTVAGALSGGILEGRRAYKKEVGRERAALSDEEFEQKIKELRGKKIKEKLESYLEAAKLKESKIWTDEKNELRKELEEKLKSKEVRGAFWRGALKGAVVGALGGAAGAALSDIIGHLFAPEKVTRAVELAGGAKDSVVKSVQDAASEAIKRETEAVAAQTYEKSIEAGLESLRKNDFRVAVAAGEGQTQLARKLIMGFIAQDRALGSDLELNKAQLIYAEDVLRRNFGEGVIKLPQVFSVKGEKILAAIEQAQNLSEEKLQNIQEKFVPKISEETWGKMTDYDAVAINSEAIDAVRAEAEKKAARAMGRAAEEAVQIADQAKNITSEVVEAKNGWFKDKWEKYGLYGLGTASGLAAMVGATAWGYKLGRRGGVKSDISEKISQVSPIGLSREPSAAGETAIKKPEKITGKTSLHLRKMLRDKIGNDIEIARSDFSIDPEMEYDGLKRLEQLIETDKGFFEKIKGSLLYMTTSKTAKVEKGNKGRIVIPINPKLTAKQMRYYLEDAVKK